MPQKPKYLIRNLLLSVALLYLPFADIGMDSNILELVGRTHPLIVHFPIVVILITALFEWWQGHSQSHHIQWMLNLLFNLSLYSSILAVAAGFLLYQMGDYEGDFAIRHLWGGIGLTILVQWSRLFRKAFQDSKKWRARQIYRMLIFVAGIVVIYTSHLGGSLTHGPAYLTEPINDFIQRRQLKNVAANKKPESLQIYADLVLPIFKNKCLKCHNGAKTKGGLNMTDLALMKRGGKSEKPGIVENDPSSSEIFSRVSLPHDHDDVMPPDGKALLDQDELNILSWWISRGAQARDTVGSGPIDSTLAASLERYLPKVAEAQVASATTEAVRRKLSPKLIRLGIKNGLRIQSDPKTDSTYYSVSMQLPPQPVSDEQIAALLPYSELYSKISLVSANLSEEGLYYLSQMPNLEEIILTKCCIKGEGLIHLSKLQKLKLLNLSHTDVDDLNVMQLTSFPHLKEVYLFNTFVNPNIVQLLDAHMKETKVCLEEGPYF